MHHRTWRGPPPARIIDGSPQWAYKGMPLYTYVKDVKTGDKNGDGVGGVWKVVQ
jgi:predicted lipoprotein with Yx(FWY)xxD motif